MSTLKPPNGHARPAPDDSRPASLWPDSTRTVTLGASGFAATRFDPLAEEHARLQKQLAATFDVCHPGLALRAVLLVQLVLALVTLTTVNNAAQWGSRQAAMAFAGVAGTLLWLVPLCAVRPWLYRLRAPGRMAAVLLLGAGAAGLAWWPLWWAGLAGPAHGLRVAGVLLSGVAFAALLWAWLELRARIWEPANARARLAELQSRIRPHFLFNALNTALALVRLDPERAERVLEDLAQLFRVALADVGASVTLAEEFDLARRYLEIEEIRFGARLQVQWLVDPRVNSARVPPLVLQPLVENAVRHGIEPSADGGQVLVTARVRRGQAEVLVSNTLGAEHGQPGAPANPGHGMALHNVRERLRLLHDVAAECTVWEEAGMFHARVVLPLP
jgi:two-component system sensor histidine kinase AlgZ